MMVSSSAFKTFILKLSAHDEANHFFLSFAGSIQISHSHFIWLLFTSFRGVNDDNSARDFMTI